MSRLLLLVATILTLHQVGRCQEFAYFRCNNSTKILQFVYIGDLTFYDFYAETRSSTCGLRAGAFTGKGTFGDPYILEINLSGGLLTQQPDCGVKQSTDSTLNLVMIKQKTCEANSSTDQRYVSSCKVTLPPSNYTTTSGQASYYCVYPGSIKFTYQQTSLDLPPPADIYALGKRATCSKFVGSGSGLGVEGNPFQLQIDATNTVLDCGVMSTDVNIYTVLIYVQQYPTVLTKYDYTYQLTCNFSNNATITLQSQITTVVSQNPTQVLSQRPTSASLSVVSGSGSAGLSSLVVGDQIRLVAQLLDSPATGLRVTSCTASPGQGMLPVIQVLNTKGCSTQPVLVPPFVGQSPTGTVAMTGLFNAFKFEQSNTVFFQCNASVCYDGDLRCLGSHCNLNSRRKREAADDPVQVLGVTLTVKDNVTSTGREEDLKTPKVQDKSPVEAGTKGAKSSADHNTTLQLLDLVLLTVVMAASMLRP
nr:CAHypothetical predicted protein [Biomphalaria glabrata]